MILIVSFLFFVVVFVFFGSVGYSLLSFDGINLMILFVDVMGGVGVFNLCISDVGDFNLYVLDDVSDFVVSLSGV